MQILRGKWLLFLVIPASLSGCAQYRAQPVDLRANREVVQARSLDESPIRERLRRSGVVAAETAFPLLQWNRAQLLVAATEHNPALIQARQQWRVSTAGVVTAKALQNPTLSLGSEYSLSQSSESPWLWSLSLNWLWDLGTQRNLRIALASAQVQAARVDYAEVLWSLRSQLRAAELSLLMAAQRQRQLEEMLDSQQQALRLQRQQATLGAISALELLPAQQELARLQTASAQNLARYRSAQAQLAQLLGVPAAALSSVRIQWDEVMQVMPMNDAELVSWREQALLSRGDLEKAVIDYQGRELALQQQVRLQYPQLSIGPGYTWDHGAKKATLGLSFNLPLFNRNQGPVAEALALRDAAGEQVLATQSVILNEIDATAALYQQSILSLQAQLKQSEAAESAYTRTQQSRQLGSADQATLIAAQLAWQVQKLAVLDQVEAMQSALGKLEDALRRPLTGPEKTLNSPVITQP